MKAGKSWSLRDVDEQTRAALLKAAEKSGLSVTDWLGTRRDGDPAAGQQQAAPSSSAPSPRPGTAINAMSLGKDEFPAGDDPSLEVREAIARLTARLGVMDETARAAVNGLPARLSEIENRLAFLVEAKQSADERRSSLNDASMMIDALVRDIDGAAIRASTYGSKPAAAPIAPAGAPTPPPALVRPAPQSEPMPAPRLVAPLAPSPAAPSVAVPMPVPQPSPAAEQLADIRYQLDALLAHDGAAQPKEPPPRTASSSEAVLRVPDPRAEQAEPQAAKASVAPRPSATPSGAADHHLHRLEAQLGEIMARLPAKKDADLASAIRDISTRQKAIDERAEATAMRRDQQALNQAVAALHGEVSALHSRVATISKAGSDDTAIAGLAQRLEALTADRPIDRSLLQGIRGDLDQLKATVGDSSLRTAIKELEARHAQTSDRVDRVLTKVPDAARIEALGEEISAVRHLLESEGRDGANERLEMRLADLASRVETIAGLEPAPAAPVTVDLSKIEQRFDSLAKTVAIALSRSPITPDTGDDTREVRDRLDAIAANLGRLMEKANSAQNAPSPTVAALEGRLSQMASDINGLLDREATGERAPVIDKIEAKLETLAESLDGLFVGMPPNETNAVLKRIDERFDRMTVGGSAEGLSRIEERLERIAGDLEHFGAPKPGTIDEDGLNRRLDQIGQTITGLGKRLPSTVEIETLHARLAGLADRIERANVTTPDNAIQADLEDIRTEVSSIRAVHQRLQTLTERIDSMAAVQHQPLLAIAEIKDGIGAIRALHDRMQTITDRVDRMSSAQRDPVQGEQLKAGIAAMRAVQERVQLMSDRLDQMAAPAQNDQAFEEMRAGIAAIGTVHEEMRSLADRISGMAVQRAPVAVLEDIKKDIVSIRTEIAGRRAPSTETLEKLVANLANQVATVSRAPSDPAGIQDLAHRVTELAGELEEAKPRVQRLEDIEQRMARLQESLTDTRRELIDAAKTEARAVVQDLSRMVATGEVDAGVIAALVQDLENLKSNSGDSDRRVRSKLDAVNTTLAQVVARLSQLEGEATRRANAEPSTERDWPEQSALVEAPQPVVQEEAPVEKEGQERRADFIAAARRAAQAAAAEANKPATGDGDAGRGEKQGALARFSQAILNRKRNLLLAAAAVVLAVGALQIFANRLATSPHGPPLIAAKDAPAALPAPAAKPLAIASAAPTSPLPAKADVLVLTSQTSSDTAEVPPLLVAPATVDKTIAFADPVYPTAVSPTGDVTGSVPATLVIGNAPVPAAATAPASADAGPVILASTVPSDAASNAVYPLVDRTIGSSKLTGAALNGDPGAAFEVGSRYAAGDRVPRNMAKAAEWYQHAAEAGLAVAEFRLGSLYERGDGVTQDVPTAIGWYQKAADQGNVNAMHNLAVLLSQDTSATANTKLALKWFQAAANYGLRDSQYNLGVIYARGLGTVANLPDSYKWFAIAAQGGDADAGARRDELAKSMSAGEIAQARSAAANWHAKAPNASANAAPVPAGGWDSDIVAQSDQQALVKTIQTLLADQGFDPGPADGRTGPKTRQAVKDYQRKSGVPETGALDNTLLASLSGNGR